MSRRFLLFTCIMLSLLVTTTAFAKKGGRGGGGGKIPVSVTFADRAGDRLGSDCWGTGVACPFIDGQHNVSASVGPSFDLQKQRKSLPTGPHLWIDFSCPGCQWEKPPWVVPATVNKGLEWKTLALGESRTGMRLQLGLDFPDGRATLFFLEHSLPGCLETNGVTVTRSDDVEHPDRWVVEADENSIACVVHGHENRGYFNIPFKMTVERWP